MIRPSGQALIGTAAWVSLGSNLGDRRKLMSDALRALDARDGLRLEAVSSLYQTPPWGDEDQAPFLNAVARLMTGRTPDDLLKVLLRIEDGLGRRRDEARRWGPRCIDLDLLLYGDRMHSSDHLVVPHPRLHERAFVLAPLLEVSPNQEIPGLGPAKPYLHALDTADICVVASGSWWFS